VRRAAWTIRRVPRVTAASAIALLGLRRGCPCSGEPPRVGTFQFSPHGATRKGSQAGGLCDRLVLPEAALAKQPCRALLKAAIARHAHLVAQSVLGVR
jgi:hypothetical protein